VLGEERVGVVDDVLGGGEVAQPRDGVAVVGGEGVHLLDGRLRITRLALLEGVERGLEAIARLGQQVLDATRERPGLLEDLAGVGRGGLGRVVDEQHDAEVRVLLEGRRQEGRAHHPLVLLVGGHEHGDGRDVLLEEVVDGGAGGPPVAAAPVEEPDAGDEVGHRRRGERGDDEEVDDRLDHQAGAAGPALDELLEDGERDVGDPSADGQDDRQAAHADPPVRDGRRNGGQRLVAAVASPLAACPLLRFHRRLHSRSRSSWPVASAAVRPRTSGRFFDGNGRELQGKLQMSHPAHLSLRSHVRATEEAPST